MIWRDAFGLMNRLDGSKVGVMNKLLSQAMKTFVRCVLALLIASHAPAQDLNLPSVCSGVVRDLTGAPVAGVCISYYPGGLFMGDYTETLTDKNGRYEAHAPKPKYGSIAYTPVTSIIARDAARNLAAIEIFTDGKANVDLVLHPALTITGTVKNTEGKPIGDATVDFRFFSGTRSSGGGYSPKLDSKPVKTDGAGQFAVSTLPQGCTYEIVNIEANGYGSFDTEIPAKDTETNHYSLPTIVLKTADRILAGQVIGPDGKPVPGITVRFSGRGQPWGTNDFPNTKTDARGNFIFNEVCDGEVQITADGVSDAASGHASIHSPLGAASMFQAGETNIVIKVGENQ